MPRGQVGALSGEVAGRIQLNVGGKLTGLHGHGAPDGLAQDVGKEPLWRPGTPVRSAETVGDNLQVEAPLELHPLGKAVASGGGTSDEASAAALVGASELESLTGGRGGTASRLIDALQARARGGAPS